MPFYHIGEIIAYMEALRVMGASFSERILNILSVCIVLMYRHFLSQKDIGGNIDNQVDCSCVMYFSFILRGVLYSSKSKTDIIIVLIAETDCIKASLQSLFLGLIIFKINSKYNSSRSYRE